MSKFSLRLMAVGIFACAVPAFGQINDGFETYPAGNLPPQGGWIDFGGSQPITVSTVQAHSGTKSMRLSEGTDTQGGTTTGYGSDVYKNFLPAGGYTNLTHSAVQFSYWQYIDPGVDSVMFNYISTGRMPATFQTGLDLRADAPNQYTFGSSMLAVQDLGTPPAPTLAGNPRPLVFGRWAQHVVSVNLTANTYNYSYDGFQMVTAGQWDTTPGDGISIAGINFWNQLRNTNAINDFVYYDDFATVATAVPEPASIALLGFGALAAARRRRA
ncbi:MAG: PEP-CTERM sorting domain-containing protein [Anaerolineae bacterium]|nr:PEP-CTERM sorting domain-containing protein [Phycisphaerae bacterium]